MIALLCPTKARPQQCKRMIESAIATSEGKLEIYLDIERAPIGGAIYDLPKHERLTYCLSESAPGLPTAHKWNMLAEEAMKNPDNKLCMLAADDMVFSTPLWDQALIESYNSLSVKSHVFALRDSRDENGTPHPIMSREYVEAMGYFVPPIFLHWFIDSWTVEIAKANNCFLHLKDYLLIHDKPSDKGQADATHTGIRAMGWHDRDKWVAEHCGEWLEDQKRKLIKRVCPQGHVIQGWNLYRKYEKNGGKVYQYDKCRTCFNKYQRERYNRQ